MIRVLLLDYRALDIFQKVILLVALHRRRKFAIIVQVIFYFLWDHWTHSGYFENRIPVKPALGERMQPRKLQCCI